MLRLETSPPERVRVIGELTGATFLVLLEMVKTSHLRLDLSEVREVDIDAVRALAQLDADACDRLGCPRWLAVRVESERCSLPSAPAA